MLSIETFLHRALFGQLKLALLDLTQLLSHLLGKGWHLLLPLNLFDVSVTVRTHQFQRLLVLSFWVFERSADALPAH